MYNEQKLRMHPPTHTIPRISTLQNGLRVMLIPKKESAVATILMAVGVGSKDETESVNGLAHFLEHMVFKGSHRYPTPTEFNRAVASMGGEFNASTATEVTEYTLKLPDENLEEGLGILADAVLFPLLRREDVAREREVVIDEIRESSDSVEDNLEDLFNRQLFGNTCYGRPVGGFPKTVHHLTHAHLQNLHKNAYVAKNMVLTVVTDRPEKKVLEAIHHAFKAAGAGKAPLRPHPSYVSSKNKTHLERQDGNLTYLSLGGLGPCMTDSTLAELEVAITILGGTEDARLPLLLRESLGKVYNVSSSIETYEDTGSYSTFAACEPKNFKEVAKLITDQMRLITESPPTGTEINLAKKYLQGSFAIEMDDQESLAEFYAQRLLLGHELLTPEARSAQWEKVDKKAVMRALKRWVNPTNFHLCAIGPIPRNQTLNILTP